MHMLPYTNKTASKFWIENIIENSSCLEILLANLNNSLISSVVYADNHGQTLSLTLASPKSIHSKKNTWSCHEENKVSGHMHNEMSRSSQKYTKHHACIDARRSIKNMGEKLIYASDYMNEFFYL